MALKIGIDVGRTLVTRLGKRGDRDNICLGIPAQHAAELEEGSNDSEITISQSIYNALDGNELQKNFTKDTTRKSWVAKGLTWERIDAQEDANFYREKALTIGMITSAVVLGAAAAYKVSEANSREEQERSVQPSIPYAP